MMLKLKIFAKFSSAGFKGWILFFATMLSLNVQARTFTGLVSHVTDGDTIWVITSAHHKPVKVRLQGMDAPEICQDYGQRAQAILAQQIGGQQVQVTSRAIDMYGRALGRVRANIGGSYDDAGAWMVRNGHAWSYHYRRAAGPYAQEERSARSAGLGLWASGNPMEPRVFRKVHGSCHK